MDRPGRRQGLYTEQEQSEDACQPDSSLLGAIAFQMLDMSQDKNDPKPIFDGVPLEPFQSPEGPVADRLVAAGQGTRGL